MMKKRGITPMISTVLLIMIVVVIAVIILLWYMNFQGEQLLKFDKPIDFACGDVYIEPYMNLDNSTGYKNKGNVPVYAVNLQLTDEFGNIKTEKITGERGGKADIGDVTIFLNSDGSDFKITSDYDEITVVPILYGKTNSGTVKEYECPNTYGVKI